MGEQVSSKSFPVFMKNINLDAFLKFATCSNIEKFQDFAQKNPSKCPKNHQILIVLRILFQRHSAAKMLQFSDKVNPCSHVNTNSDVGVTAIGNHQ